MVKTFNHLQSIIFTMKHQ